MIRTQKNKPSAILCADIHLRETVPICRTDDFISEQLQKLDFISDLQKQYNCPVLCAGDLFDHWKPSPWLLSKAIQYLPNNFYTVYGQHDLPQHSLDLVDKCGVNTLSEAKKLKILPVLHWGQTPHLSKNNEGEFSYIIRNPYRRILVWHRMTYKGKEPWPGCSDPSAIKLLKQYPQYDLIVTGDNHIPFVQEYEGRLLVNPGSMMRQDADQIDHKPRVYLWYAETNTVEPVYLPIKENVISREHIEIVQQRNDRLDAYISKLNEDWTVTLEFEKNLEIFEKKNKVKQPIVDIINKSLEI